MLGLRAHAAPTKLAGLFRMDSKNMCADGAGMGVSTDWQTFAPVNSLLKNTHYSSGEGQVVDGWKKIELWQA